MQLKGDIMHTERVSHRLELHFDKPIGELSQSEIDYIHKKGKELGKNFDCKIVTIQTTSKSGHKKVILNCKKKSKLKNI